MGHGEYRICVRALRDKERVLFWFRIMGTVLVGSAVELHVVLFGSAGTLHGGATESVSTSRASVLDSRFWPRRVRALPDDGHGLSLRVQ
jgi:hypothetical protein